MTKIELRKKKRWTLVGIEILLISILLSYWLAKKFAWDTMTGIVCGVVSLLILGGLFFGVRIFRYIFSIGFFLILGLSGLYICRFSVQVYNHALGSIGSSGIDLTWPS
jgi:uncharacterized membrane protein